LPALPDHCRDQLIAAETLLAWSAGWSILA
jgi:hypothetical protein